MANEEHVELLKQGWEALKDWRGERPTEILDLSKSDLSNLKLHKVNLKNANFRGANLQGASLSETKLDKVDLRGVDLSGANIQNVVFRAANLNGANINGAAGCSAHFDGAILVRDNLSRAKMRFTRFIAADLSYATLSFADLHSAFLHSTNLSYAEIDGANFHRAMFGRTVLVDIDFGKARDLKSATHAGPSEISISTVSRSADKIPDKFLQGCGLLNWEIESARFYRSGLSARRIEEILYKVFELRVDPLIQFYSCFI